MVTRMLNRTARHVPGHGYPQLHARVAKILVLGRMGFELSKRSAAE